MITHRNIERSTFCGDMRLYCFGMFFIKFPGKDFSTIIMMPGINKSPKRKISGSSNNGFTTIDNTQQKKISNKGGKTSRTFTKSGKSTDKHKEMDDVESLDYFNPRFW